MPATHCPADGGWIGDGGCSHPRHKHSEFLTKMLDERPREIEPSDADKMLAEGFYVTGAKIDKNDPNEKAFRVSFGKTLERHLASKQKADADGRKRRLLYAVNAVVNGRRVENPNGRRGVIAWAAPADGNLGVVVTADRKHRVKWIFDILPRKDRRIDYTPPKK